MKKDYKLSIFQLILLVILIINSVFYNFLSNYGIIILLVIVLVLFKLLFGFEKDRHRYTKDCIMNITVYLLIFFILYYLLGIVVTFTKNEGFYTFYGFLNFTLRVFIFIILKEFYRYNLLCKSENSKFNIVLSILIFILFDITNNIYSAPLTNKYVVFEFIAVYVMPSLANNIFATFLSKRVGYKPVIFYLEIISLYTYILPIYPDPNKYFYSVIWFCLPLVLLYKEFNFFKRESDEDIERDYNKKRISYLLIALLFTAVLVYFTSGNFHYHALAIASGSMTPKIRKGDVVIVEKLDGKIIS